MEIVNEALLDEGGDRKHQPNSARCAGLGSHEKEALSPCTTNKRHKHNLLMSMSS
jgi:hypothetical protein